MPLIADVTNKEQLIDAKNKVLDAYGKIDGLVNAAGGNIAGAEIYQKHSFELDDLIKNFTLIKWIATVRWQKGNKVTKVRDGHELRIWHNLY